MKGYSNSLAIGELEIETRRHHFAPIKLKRLGGLESVQCGQERTDIRMFSCYSGECSTSSSEDPTLIHPIKYTHALWLGHFSPGWLYIPKKFLHTHEGARTKMSLAVCFMVTGTWQHLVSIPGGGDHWENVWVSPWRCTHLATRTHLKSTVLSKSDIKQQMPNPTPVTLIKIFKIAGL